MVGVRVESCKIVFLEGQFLFTCSHTFAVGYRLATVQSRRRTDGRTDRLTDDRMMLIAVHNACSSTIG